MPANLETSAVATGLERVSFPSNPKERQRQRMFKFSSVHSLGYVWLFVTPWNAARQASLFITNSWSLLKLMSIELVRPSNHFILCRPHLLLPSIFEHYFASMWDGCNCVVVWAFFGIGFLWDWNENWPFPVLWSLLSFPNLLAYWVQHFHRIIF